MVTGQSRNNSSNTLVVPQASSALDQLKYEVAQELGIQIPQDGYYGYMTSYDTGSIGGNITRRLVQIAEQQLAGSAGVSANAKFSR
ncbi:alpha/beta-type small acid-soluble spore protein [Paenibacillus oryzisoli]|uniref:small, acid-soluble spore protein, alpha/beta type n=1 Tax=Paenibacillus oryzisoli TaxID=1850517 RepID=UPI003D2B7A85